MIKNGKFFVKNLKHIVLFGYQKTFDEIIQVNDKKNPRKKDLIEALRDCEGREINLHIKNKSGAIIKKIKPFN